jgi:hypothetical protein
MTANDDEPTLPQQEFLLEAMARLGRTSKQFASRIHVAQRTLDKWLLSDLSPDSRRMPDTGHGYTGEILKGSAKKR